MSGVFPAEVFDGPQGKEKRNGRKVAKAVLTKMGLPDVKALEEAPYEAFAAAWKAVSPELARKGYYVGGDGPVANASYLGDPMKVGFRKETAGIPMIVGSTLGEFLGMLVGEENLKALPEAAQKAFVNRIYGPLADEILPLFRAAYPDRSTAEMLTLDYVCRAGVLPYVSVRGAMNDCTYT